jgi:N-acetylglucosamine-6-sulfatase
MANKYLKVILAGLFLFAGGIMISSCDVIKGTKSQPPNFIVILTDDQGAATMDFMPILNRELVARGIKFDQGYVTTPLCCPSRSSILTGEYAHHHGVLDNRLPLGGATRFKDSSTIAVWLKQAGYRTALIGKYLNEYNNLTPAGYIPPGWDQWNVFYDGTRPHRFYQNYDLAENGVINHYGIKIEDFSTDVLADRAVDFIKSSKGKPFFLLYAPYAPHPPFEFANRHKQLFRDDQQILDLAKPSFDENDISDKPAWMQLLGPFDRELAVSMLQRTLRSIQSVDDAIGKFLEALDQTNERKNTVVIYLSDNGLTYGEHRLTGEKNCQFEECIKVPFVIYYPKLIKKPRVDSHLVLNIDLAPTIADLAGIQLPPNVDGTSLVPLLDGTASTWRDTILFEHWRLIEGFGSIIPDFTGIRTGQWKYVEYVTGDTELYDLQNDPYEMNNLANSSEYTSVKADLAVKLENLRKSTGFDKDLRNKILEQVPDNWVPTPDDLPDE